MSDSVTQEQQPPDVPEELAELFEALAQGVEEGGYAGLFAMMHPLGRTLRLNSNINGPVLHTVLENLGRQDNVLRLAIILAAARLIWFERTAFDPDDHVAPQILTEPVSRALAEQGAAASEVGLHMDAGREGAA